MIRLFRNKKKVSIKGRMPGNHLLVPGMYYEKVYLNSMITSYRLYAFHLFDGFSIQKRCEERMINK